MDFLELQQKLRDAKLDPFLAYDGRFNTLRPDRHLVWECLNSWCVAVNADLPLPFSVQKKAYPLPPRGGGAATCSDPQFFETDARANDYIWEQIAPTSEAGPVEAIAISDVPNEVAEWLATVGWAPPRNLFGNHFVASGKDQSLRISRTDRGYHVYLEDHYVPRNSPPRYTSASLDDACRWIILFVGRRYRRPLGQDIWGFQNKNGELGGAGTLERTQAVTLGQLGDAFLDSAGGGILDFLAHGPALDLLTPALLAEALAARFLLSQRAEPRSLSLSSYTLREVDGGYTISYRERNEDDVIASVDTVEELREEFARIVRRR